VCAPSPPVPTMSTQSSGSSTGVAWSSIVAARPATSSATRPWPAGRRRRRRSGRAWPRRSSPRASPRRCRPAERSSRASSRLSRPARWGARRSRSPAAQRRTTGRRTRSRSRSGHDTGAVSGSTGNGSVPSASDQCASQRSGWRAMRTHTRRAVGDLLVELTGQRQAAGGLRLAVEDAQVDAAGVDGGDDLVAGLALDPGQRADVGGRAGGRPPSGRPRGPRAGGCRPARWPACGLTGRRA
jgi:hypothetical protein